MQRQWIRLFTNGARKMTTPVLPNPSPVPDTPCVVVRQASLLNNVKRMAAKAAEKNVKLRPHIKTHKSFYIGNLQREFGSSGIMCAKVGEALRFIDGGFCDVTVGMPIVHTEKLKRLLRKVADKGVRLQLTIDHPDQISRIQMAATEVGFQHRIGAYLKVNVGLNRCGVDNGSTKIDEIVERVEPCKNLHLIGLMSHAGNSYAAKNKKEVIEIGEKEVETLKNVRDYIHEKFPSTQISEISVGSTITELCRENYDGVTEMRPGNYVLCDNNPLKLGLCTVDDVACFVFAQVISVNDHHIIIDCGSKVLSSDGGAHGLAAAGYGTAWKADDSDSNKNCWIVKSLSEEHGWLERNGDDSLQVGDFVWVLPNHSCPVMNLTNQYLLMSESGHTSVEVVEARGLVQ